MNDETRPAGIDPPLANSRARIVSVDLTHLVQQALAAQPETVDPDR
ncbi:hypothetical protein [Microbacterium sp. 18062]|nr:hypothetical protein [Microbacterium sp. 18062]